MQGRWITYDEAVAAITWDGAVDALQRGHQLPRAQIADLQVGQEPSLLLGRAAGIAGMGHAVKAETVRFANAAQGLPTVQGVVVLYDDATGAVRAVIESRVITEYKTAADSVLGACLLARPQSRRLVILGAGAVAASLIPAYLARFPALEEIAVWARREEQAEALVAAQAELGPRITVVRDLPSAVARADIVATATMAQSPILLGDWVQPGTHVDLLGAFTPSMREADDALMAKGRVYVDARETTVACIGELLQPLASGALAPQDVLGDLYDMVGGGCTLRTADDDITVFKNGGGAHLDLMLAAYVVERLAAATRL